jgi:outer membrane protein OmpA-like peptidoglycan-associated protein
MRKTYLKTLALFAFFCIAALSYGQNPYWLGIGAHSVNFVTDKYFEDANYQHNWGPTRLSIGIPVTDRFKALPTFSLGKAKGTTEGVRQQDIFWDADLSIVYSLLPDKRIEPYLVGGGGVNRINEVTYGVISGGLGLNLWLTEGFGFNLQTNYDAMRDHHQYWHNSVGIIFRMGGAPKDSDKDGIPDETDACPKQAGPSATQGCPDADGDGVKDTDDACPSEAGTAATQGCPDSDGDGIANAKDECPTAAGTAQFNGCPDSDGDGIVDKNDSCPNQKGTAQFNGCPDSDGDGIADKDDSCPQQAGTAALKGCPDKDGDGVADKDDNCPDEAGVPARRGCPEIKEEEVKAIETKLNVAAKKIQFETGSAKIKPASFSEIDQIVAIMNQYTFTKFDIEGHTDNTGKAETNKTLSQQRADAVRDYIAGKGISTDRLQSIGYGPDRPLAPNTTAAGRASNRRVEIHLKQE